MPDKSLTLIVCKNHEAEFRSLLQEEEFSNIELKTLVLKCGRSEQNQRVVDELEPGELTGAELVIPQTCVRGASSSAREQGPRGRLGTCFELLVGPELVMGWIGSGCYLLTPGWLQNWRRYVDEWGFEPEEARRFFKESADRLLLLDSGLDPRARDNLREMGEFLSTRGEAVPVGLSYLRLYLSALVKAPQLDHALKQERTRLTRKCNRRIADYAAGYEMMAELSKSLSEDEVVTRILELFQMLMAPTELDFVSTSAGQPVCRSSSGEAGQVIARFCEHMAGDWSQLGDRAGFVIRLNLETDGFIWVNGLRFPEYFTHYLNLALNLRGLCTIALAGAAIRRRMHEGEVELAELRRLDSLRHFVGGAAHNFNNLLTTIIGNTDLVLMDPMLDQATISSLTDIGNAAARASDLAAQMLAFAGRGLSVRERLDLFRLVREQGERLAESSRGAFRVVLDIAGSGTRVMGSRDQIGLVIDALISNAVEALAGRPDGEIRISCRKVNPEEVHSGRLVSSDLPGDRSAVLLSIEDNGEGMGPDALARAFDPFFSTRAVGRGLGLAAVLGIVKTHQGAISLQSEPGRGTLVSVGLPVIREAGD